MGVSSLLLIPSLFVPLWKINLVAPQYTEGLSLYIYLDGLSGAIQNYDLLNHYIGMAPMPVDLIEFKIFPAMVVVFIFLGLLVSYIDWGYSYWIGLVCASLCIAGIRFYSHLYDHSHNLDPRAPIKIEGMDYTPPMIGRKTILNFTATATPNLGALFITSSLLGAVACLKLKE